MALAALAATDGGDACELPPLKEVVTTTSEENHQQALAALDVSQEINEQPLEETKTDNIKEASGDSSENAEQQKQITKSVDSLSVYKNYARLANRTLTTFTNEMSEILRESIERLDNISMQVRGCVYEIERQRVESVSGSASALPPQSDYSATKFQQPKNSQLDEQICTKTIEAEKANEENIKTPPPPPPSLSTTLQSNNVKQLTTSAKKSSKDTNPSSMAIANTKTIMENKTMQKIIKQHRQLLNHNKKINESTEDENVEQNISDQTMASPLKEPKLRGTESHLERLRRKYDIRKRQQQQRKSAPSTAATDSSSPPPSSARQSGIVSDDYVKKNLADLQWFGPKLSATSPPASPSAINRLSAANPNVLASVKTKCKRHLHHLHHGSRHGRHAHHAELKNTKLGPKFANQNFRDPSARDRAFKVESYTGGRLVRLTSDSKQDWSVIMHTQKAPTRYELKQNSPFPASNILDEITLKDLEPLKAEYPRKDRMPHELTGKSPIPEIRPEDPNQRLEDTLLYKLVNSDSKSLELLIDIKDGNNNNKTKTFKKPNVSLVKENQKKNRNGKPEEKPLHLEPLGPLQLNAKRKASDLRGKLARELYKPAMGSNSKLPLRKSVESKQKQLLQKKKTQKMQLKQRQQTPVKPSNITEIVQQEITFKKRQKQHLEQEQQHQKKRKHFAQTITVEDYGQYRKMNEKEARSRLQRFASTAMPISTNVAAVSTNVGLPADKQRKWIVMMVHSVQFDKQDELHLLQNEVKERLAKEQVARFLAPYIYHNDCSIADTFLKRRNENYYNVYVMTGTVSPNLATTMEAPTATVKKNAKSRKFFFEKEPSTIQMKPTRDTEGKSHSSRTPVAAEAEFSVVIGKAPKMVMANAVGGAATAATNGKVGSKEDPSAWKHAIRQKYNLGQQQQMDALQMRKVIDHLEAQLKETMENPKIRNKTQVIKGLQLEMEELLRNLESKSPNSGGISLQTSIQPTSTPISSSHQQQQQPQHSIVWNSKRLSSASNNSTRSATFASNMTCNGSTNGNTQKPRRNSAHQHSSPSAATTLNKKSPALNTTAAASSFRTVPPIDVVKQQNSNASNRDVTTRKKSPVLAPMVDETTASVTAARILNKQQSSVGKQSQQSSPKDAQRPEEFSDVNAGKQNMASGNNSNVNFESKGKQSQRILMPRTKKEEVAQTEEINFKIAIARDQQRRNSEDPKICQVEDGTCTETADEPGVVKNKFKEPVQWLEYRNEQIQQKHDSGDVVCGMSNNDGTDSGKNKKKKSQQMCQEQIDEHKRKISTLERRFEEETECVVNEVNDTLEQLQHHQRKSGEIPSMPLPTFMRVVQQYKDSLTQQQSKQTQQQQQDDEEDSIVADNTLTLTATTSSKSCLAAAVLVEQTSQVVFIENTPFGRPQVVQTTNDKSSTRNSKFEPITPEEIERRLQNDMRRHLTEKSKDIEEVPLTTSSSSSDDVDSRMEKEKLKKHQEKLKEVRKFMEYCNYRSKLSKHIENKATLDDGIGDTNATRQMSEQCEGDGGCGGNVATGEPDMLIGDGRRSGENEEMQCEETTNRKVVGKVLAVLYSAVFTAVFCGLTFRYSCM